MLIRLLRRYLPPYGRPIALVVVLQLAQAAATLYLPTLNADIIDDGVLKGDTGYILRTGGVMLTGSLIQVGCAIGAVFFSARISMALGRDLRAAVFQRVLAFSARDVGRFGTPSLITRTTNDVQQVQMLVLMTFALMITAPIMCVGGIVMALNLDVPLSGLLVIIVPVLGVAIIVIIRRMGPFARVLQARIDQVNRVVREQIAGVRVIRAFVRDDYERRRFARTNKDLLDVSLPMGRLTALMLPTAMLVVYSSSVAVMWFGGHRVGSGAMPIGALTAFLTYLTQILAAVMMATMMFLALPRAQASAERIRDVLDTEPGVLPPVRPVRPTSRGGRIDLHGVEFRYPGAEEPVLRGIDLVAGPGEITAIIGSTGSGKTTLLNLVPRLFDATAGTVLVNGVDVRDLDPEELSRTVGLVPQKPYLFSGTVASNLRYGKPDATDEELWRALETAQARDFVERMPGGLDAEIAQGGGNVSGGQRQRLAIARTVVHRPEIYLFDDSFSALDYATDAALREALRDDTRDATVVIVAQRISTIRDADRIVILDLGRIVGIGSHDDLMAANETYREIVFSQLSVEEAA